MADNCSEETTSKPILVHKSPFLKQQEQENDGVIEKNNIALVILNSPIRSPPSPLFKLLWEKSSVRVCADGGANRLYRADPTLIPTLVRGDLDSLDDNVRSYYASKGVSIERDPNQDNNDLDKALTSLKSDSFTQVIVYGAFGGRFDQEMASMQALFKWSDNFKYKLTFFDDVTSAFLLPPNVQNEIRIPRFGDIPFDDKTVLGDGPTCGLIPLGGKCDSVVTTGFRWNLDGSIPLEFGGLVSTSNHVSESVATVIASHPLIFTAEVVCGVDTF